MNLLTNIFYSLSVLFIVVEIYQLINREQLFSKLKFDNIEKINPLSNIIFYTSKILYLFWIFLGLFSSLKLYFLILVITGLFKYFVLLTKKNILINLYDLFNCLFSVTILSIILILRFFQ